MGDPSCNSRNCEENGIHVSWEAHSSIDQSTVEVNIWIEFSTNEVLVRQCYFLKFNGDFNQRLFSTNLKNLKGNLNRIKNTFLMIFALGS